MRYTVFENFNKKINELFKRNSITPPDMPGNRASFYVEACQSITAERVHIQLYSVVYISISSLFPYDATCNKLSNMATLLVTV
jgi:hypothetical protein